MCFDPLLKQFNDIFDYIFSIPSLGLLALNLIVGVFLFPYIYARISVRIGKCFRLHVISDIISQSIIIIAERVKYFDDSVLEVYFSEFGDFFVAGGGEMVENFNFLDVFHGDFDL